MEIPFKFVNNKESLATIVKRTAKILAVEIDTGGAIELARRSRGTPRIANRLLRRVRDYAEIRSNGKVNTENTKAALDMLEVDDAGFDLMDQKLLRSIIEKFGGGPVGVENLAAAIGEDRDTIEDVLEPFLIQQGYLMRPPSAAWTHFGLKPPTTSQSEDLTLFHDFPKEQ